MLRADRPHAVRQSVKLRAASMRTLPEVCYQRSCCRIESYFLACDLFGSQKRVDCRLGLLDQAVGYRNVHEVVGFALQDRQQPDVHVLGQPNCTFAIAEHNRCMGLMDSNVSRTERSEAVV